MQPLPLVPAGAVPVADGIALAEDDSGSGAVLVWGQVTWSWGSDDPAARRLAAVQLVNARAATQREVAVAFGVNETTVWRWRQDYTSGGMEGLLATKKGPKRPSKLTEDKVADIVALRNEGRSLHEVASLTGVSPQVNIQAPV
jgi:transposase